MIRRRSVLALPVAKLLAALVLVAPAWAADVTLRVGAHGTYGRVVFVVPAGVRAQMALGDDHVLSLSMPGAGAVPDGARGTLNVPSIRGGHDSASLILAPESRPVLWQGSGKIVVDVYHGTAPSARATGTSAGSANGAAKLAPRAPGDAAAAPRSTRRDTQTARPPFLAPGAKPMLAGDATQEPQPEPAAPMALPPTPVATGPLPPPTASAPAADSFTLAQDAPTDGLVAARVPPDSIGGQDAILVPFDRGVAAAAFARAGLAHVIFDDGKPVDVAQLKDDPVFGSARVMLLPAATHLTLSLAPGKRLVLRRRPEGWVVAVVPQAGQYDAARVGLQNGTLTIGTPKPADTVVMDDPATGGRLLVGTVLGEGAAVVVPHISPEFSLLPSWTGVLVAAQSDRLGLRAVKGGFALAMETGPKLVAVIADATEQALASAGTLSRHFDFMPLPNAALRARLITDMQAVATSPKLARFTPRVRAAQDMLALGLDREAGAMLRVAMQDDPDQARNQDARALAAIADWMNGGSGASLDAAPLGSSDEMALWRAVLQPGDAGKAAATIADTWRMALAYPAALQRRLLPAAADILLRGGQREAADALLARVPDASLDPQRAQALQKEGKTDAALALLDRIGQGRDRKRVATARREAVDMRLASGKMTPQAAADALDRQLYDWRDDALEADQRLRIAALRSQAGLWRPALAMLRETEALYPATHDRVRAGETQVISNLLASSAAAHLAPLDLVSLVEENADLLAEKGASETLAPVLVDKLLALDLPERADPILGKLMSATASPEAKAGLGARLATLRLDQADPTGAKAALADSDAADLSPALAAHRAVLQARALVLGGADDAAQGLLATVQSPEALELQARLLEKRLDWHGAETVLQALAQASLPADGLLTDVQQDLVLRLASAASEAGDMAMLQRLQHGDATRLSPGPRSDLFQALATKPVQALADLPRSAREAAAATAVPAALASYDSR